MRVVKLSRAQVEQVAREEYQRQFAQAAPPKVRNAQALVALTEHRALRWRGHVYTVPPVPFREGARLHIIAQSLREAEDLSGEDVMVVRAAAVMSVRAIMPRIARRRGWRRLLPTNPFRRAHIGEVLQLVAWTLEVPDQSPDNPSGGKPPTIDLIDGVMDFARTFPGLLNAEGLPVSWAMYVYGMRHLGRAVARDTLRYAQAMRVGQADKEAWKEFSISMRSASGWE